MKGASNLREIPNEPSVEIQESNKGLDVLHLRWLWPVCDSLDLNRVHRYAVLGDDESEVIHLSTRELAFLWSEEKLVGAEGLEYSSGDSPMVCKGGGVDEDVIHVTDSLIPVNEGAEEVVHHCLEGGR